MTPSTRRAARRSVAASVTAWAGCSEREVVVGPGSSRGKQKGKGLEDAQSKGRHRRPKRLR